jgi:heme/copper-type cytochrome/quinol oxidase subunit 2
MEVGDLGRYRKTINDTGINSFWLCAKGGGKMFGLGLPELIVIVVIVGIPVAIISLIRASRRRQEHQGITVVSETPFSGEYAFTKDPTALTNFLRFMLWIYLGITIVSLVSDFMQMNLLNSAPFSQAEAEANDLRQRIITVFYLATFIVTGIVFLKWIYRANSNCHGFGAQNMKFSPGWSVGYYFIPFLNLYRPYQAMKEIWKVSKNPADWENEPGSPLLGWWWALWIISGILGQLSFRMSLRADTVGSLKESTIISIVSGLFDIPLCLVGVSMVSAIFLRQKRLTEMTPYGSATVTSEPITT